MDNFESARRLKKCAILEEEEGPKFEQGTTLTTGQRTVQEGEVE